MTAARTTAVSRGAARATPRSRLDTHEHEDVFAFGGLLGQATVTALLAAFVGLSPAARADGAATAEDLALVRSDEARRIAVLERAARSVVCIFADNRRTGGGSGVIFDERGYGLTNFHVVAEFIETRHGVGGLNDGNLYPLTVLGLDPGGDIALFKLEGKAHFDAAPLADSDRLVVGQWAAALGNPFLLAEDYTPTITVGIISGLHRYQEGQGNALEYADCIQVSSSINPGNSGGPLFDLAGRVIGINGRASFEERGRVNVGLGYAVSINQIKRFLPNLRAGRLCEHGTLGATVALAADKLIFDAVQDSAPASEAGVQLGDVLLAVNDRPMRTPNDFNNMMATLPAHWPVRLSLRRDEQPLSLVARLERLPIRKAPTFILDLKRNHEELRLVLDAARVRLVGEGGPARAIHWTGLVASAADEWRREVDVTSTADGKLSVWPIPGNQAMYLAEPPPSDSEVVHDDTTAAVWRDWRLLSWPVCFTPEVSLGWEYVGGDELEGRIVSVIERRLESKARIRWSFDTETGDLREVTIDDPVAGNAIWRPELPADPTQPFLRDWVRFGPEGATLLSITTAECERIPPSTEVGQ